MKKMIVVWVIIAVFLVGALTFIGIRYEASVKDYQILESDLVESADAYMQLGEITLNYKEAIKITSKKLVDKGLISSMEVSEDTCTGYVLIERDHQKNNYKAYIKCENYTTLDYEKH